MSRRPPRGKAWFGSGRTTAARGRRMTWRSVWPSRMPTRSSTPGWTSPLWASATSSTSTACVRPTGRVSVRDACGDAWTWPTRSSWAPSPSPSRGPWEQTPASPAPASSASWSTAREPPPMQFWPLNGVSTTAGQQETQALQELSLQCGRATPLLEPPSGPRHPPPRAPTTIT